MKTTLATLGLLAATLIGPSFAQVGPVPTGIPHLNHVFVIMMENHGYKQLINNPVRKDCQPGNELFRGCPPQPDELPGSRGRIKFRCAG
jgi:hypothetical protein